MIIELFYDIIIKNKVEGLNIMIVALSYFIAIVLTFLTAIVLYPIAAIFWICGLLGKLSDNVFNLTKRIIAYLWKDLGKVGKPIFDNQNVTVDENWTCACGKVNNGKFCSECGAQKQ